MYIEQDEDASSLDFELTSSNARFTAQPPNLPRIIKAARHAIGPELAARIGPLSLTPLLTERSWVRAIQIRSKPLRAFGGAEFRHNVMLGELATHYPVTVDGLAECLRVFAASQIYTSSFGNETRAVVTEVIERFECFHTPARILAIGLEVAHVRDGLATFATVVDLELLGIDLAPRTVRVRRFTHDHLMEALTSALTLHGKYAQALRKHQAKGSIRWIEDTTNRLMKSCGLTLDRARDFLSTEDYFAFDLDRGRQYACIEWRDGVLTCLAGSTKGSFYLKNNNLTVSQTFPDTLLMGFKGRKLGEIVEHNWLPPDAIITKAVRNRNGTKLSLKVAKVPLIWGSG
ncbi:MAG: hypothetical protein V4537_06120 [Pseudomonadota bacterium]